MRAEGALWAKKEEISGTLYWLPLLQHLEDTTGIAIQLWNHWLPEGTRQTISEGAGLDEDAAVGLVAFLAASHDLGKATPAFQTMKSFHASEALDAYLLERLERAGFEGISRLHLSTPYAVHHTLAGEKLLNDYGVRPGIASVIGAHHGKPLAGSYLLREQEGYAAYYFQNEDAEDPAHRRWDQVQRDIFSLAMEAGEYDSIDDIPEVPQAYLVLLSGVVIMADWIASNTYYFPLLPIDSEAASDSERRLERGWNRWRRSDLWTPERRDDVDELYRDRFGFSPRPEQRSFAEVVAETDDPGIFIFEAPMGRGKTEAALAGAEQLAQKTGRSGLFFGLPTQATSNSMFTRIEEWLEHTVSGEVSIQLAHGKAALNRDYAKLLGKGRHIDVDAGEGTNGNVVANAWFRGKKTTALDDFVVGTVDQFLLASLKQKHLALRHLGFSKKVVIIDEVHAYDAYMSIYLLKSIAWMAAYRVPVIILSATLPAERREAMVKAYMSGKGVKWRAVEKPDEGLGGDAYPLITYTDGNRVGQYKDFPATASKAVAIERLREEVLYDKIDALIEDGGVLGIVVNTVKRAQRIGRELEQRYGSEVVEILHSSFTATDRVRKEDALVGTIGKKGTEAGVRPKKKIIVGTQVIEQSLDIDFDVMISDLAPIDLLIQRLGRLHRHDQTFRPERLKNPIFYVLGAEDGEDYEEGARHIYGEYLLRETKENLPEELNLPEDISTLVQRVYGDLTDFDKDASDPVKDTFIRGKKDKEEKARNYVLEAPKVVKKKKTDATLTGWLNNNLAGLSEEGAYGRVRDIDESIEVILLKKLGDGYGFFEEGKDISEDIHDPSVAIKVAAHTIQLPKAVFGYGGKEMDATIDFLERYTLEHFRDWQEEPWLKGALGILLDENETFSLRGIALRYDPSYGLTYERM
ncbi:MAG: CRISPR-associated helicase Cas3' [Peptoniphilus sp.]|nr:CRISPR-associated helicase Cas3' [Peptoniphilus sp.]MDD7363425.1 CRISPR-associated helicase Cas3' [Bacillota bacterium]MDY6044427.1 CRISPR-associated helicase Cas3' [Peptoniphilus sp.]